MMNTICIRIHNVSLKTYREAKNSHQRINRKIKIDTIDI